MDHLELPSLSRSLVGVIIINVFLISLLRYLAAAVRSSAGRTPTKTDGRPPLAPNAIPILGHVPLQFFWDPLGFAHTYHAFWKRHPMRVRILCQDLYIVQGASDLVGLFRQRSQSIMFLHSFFVQNGFCLPSAAAATYRRGNSGPHETPVPGTAIQHHNRVEYHLRVSQHRLLLGTGQQYLFSRLYANMTERFCSLDIGQDWTTVPDFLDLFKANLSAAIMDSLVGPALLQRNPEFVDNLWKMDKGIVGLLLKTPRFMNREAHQARDRVLSALCDWQDWARQNFTPESVVEGGDDPFWGSSYFRKRQEICMKMDGFSYDAIASEDLSLIWGANSNGVVSAFWLALEAFRDAELLQAVREEVTPCIQSWSKDRPVFDVARLIRQPLLQAMFAENLRLRVHGFLIRRSEHDMRINKWTIPGGHWCVASSTPAAMDANFWCSGDNSGHPVDQFWPGRFLQKDPASISMVFSLKGTEGSWLPFGGGAHACPGRILVKRQNILALALMVTLFDCKILATDDALALKAGVYPLGAMPPRGDVPVRIRRKAKM